MLERELAPERAIELARPVVARPDRALVHADRNDAPREAHAHARSLAAAYVVRDFPGTNPPDHGEHERAAGPQEARALARDGGEVGHAVERPEVGVRAVVLAVARQLVQLVRADRDSVDPLRNAVSDGAVRRA